MLAGAVSPRLRSQDGRRRGRRSTAHASAASAVADRVRFVANGTVPTDGRRTGSTALAAAIYAAVAPHRDVHAAVGRREQRVLRQVPVRVRSRRCSRDIAAACVPLVPGRHRRAGRPRARRRPARHDDVAGHRAAGPLRAQGGEDLRHVPARRRRRARRRSGCASSKTSSPRAARSSTPRSSSARAARCSAPVVCVIDRESGGAEKLAAEGLELHALFTMSELRPRADRDCCRRRALRAARLRARSRVGSRRASRAA